MEAKRKKAAVYINIIDKDEIGLILDKLSDFAKDLDIDIYRQYTEKNTKFEKLQKLLKDAKEKKFDILLVWDLEYLAGSIKELNIIFEKINKYGIDFISLNNRLNTLQQGKLVFSLVNELAGFERNIKKKKIKQGIEKARQKGRRLGRPGLPDNIYQKAKELRAKGLTYRQIGTLLNINEGTVRKKMKEEREKLKIKSN